MRTNVVCTAAFAASAGVCIAASVQQAPWGFSVRDGNGRPVLMAKLGQGPYKSGAEPSVFWNLDAAKAVRDKDGNVISSFGFYGWTEGATTRVAVIARLPPAGAENRFYSWPELNKTGLKPRLELFATYTLTAGETKMMDELKAIGGASVRIETEQPKKTLHSQP